MNTLETNNGWAAEEQIPTAEPKCPTVYYDVGRKDYWILNQRDEWIAVNEGSLRRHLRQHGLSPKRAEGEFLAPLDAALNKIQCSADVAHAGPLAGYSKGFVEIGRQRILVTSSARLLVPQDKPFPVLEKLLTNMFGNIQLLHVMGWLKVAFESLREDAPDRCS